MLFNEYANIKIEGYKSLGWNIYELVSNDKEVSFKTRDTTGQSRYHYYSENAIEVSDIENIEEILPEQKKNKRTKKARNEKDCI